MCPLCQKIAGARTLYQTEWIASLKHSEVFLGPWQFYEGYCVVTARHHYTELFEIPIEIRHALMDEVALVAKAIYEVVQPRKINYEWLGNQVPHLHWHLFPRQSEDPHHLQAVWLDIAAAEQNPELRTRWQQSQRGREKIITEIQQALGR